MNNRPIKLEPGTVMPMGMRTIKMEPGTEHMQQQQYQQQRGYPQYPQHGPGPQHYPQQPMQNQQQMGGVPELQAALSAFVAAKKPKSAVEARAVLQQFQTHRSQVLHQAVQQGQMNTNQFNQELHQMNESLRLAYQKYQAQLQQAQAQQQQQQQRMQQGGPSGQQQPQPQQQQQAPPGQMPPPQMPPAGMSAAEKKKMLEMQKQRSLMAQQQQAQQQQQQQGIRFPPGTSLQQQQQLRMQYQQQQQQAQQNAQNPAAGYRGMGPQGAGGPGYPMGPAGAGMGTPHGMNMQPQTPQSLGGPPSVVSNPGSVQSQHQQQQQQQQFQQQQQQYYQQQQNQQQQQQQMHQMHQQQQMQQHMQQQQHQQMQHQQQPQQPGQPQHPGAGGPAHFQQAPPPQQQQQAAPQPPPPPPPVEKPEDVKYRELLKELRAQYYEVLKGMQRRNSQQKGMVQMIQILDGERQVPYEQLLGLAPSLQRLMIRDCPTFPLMDRIRQIIFPNKEDREKVMQTLNFVESREALSSAAEKASARLAARRKDRDTLGVNPWKSVAHLEIRVPPHLLALYKKPEELEAVAKKAEEEKNLKRLRGMGEEADGADRLGKKREKKEDEPMEEDMPPEEEDASTVDQRFLVKTLFDTRKPWIIPPKARDELSSISANWSIDDHFLPSCATSPFVIICVKSPFLLVNPLRICLPRDYPNTPITVQFDRSFPETSECAATLQKLYERNLATRTAPTLTDFVDVWQTACEEYQVFAKSGSVPPSIHSSQHLQTIGDFERAAALPTTTTVPPK